MKQIKLISRIDRAKELDKRVDDSVPALAEIHRGEYYFELGFETMKDYLKSKGKSYLSSWQTIAAIKAQNTLPDIKMPNVSTAIEVGKIPMPQRRKVVEDAIAQSEGKLSVPAIKKAVASQPIADRRLKLPRDGTGIEIPPEIQEFYNRNEEVDHLLRMVKQVRLAVENAREKDDRLYKGIDQQAIISKCLSIAEELDCAKSYAICPDCNGIFIEKCATCKGRGTLSRFWWERQPEEIKSLRE